MRIEQGYIFADEGKFIHRKGYDAYGISIYLSKGDAIDDFEEVDTIPEPSNVRERDDLINAKIRERYSESNELAILRQRDRKPEEFKAYDEYCEQCKREVDVELAKEV